MQDDLIKKAGNGAGPAQVLGTPAFQAVRIPGLRTGWNTRIAAATFLTGIAVTPIPLEAMDLDLFDGLGADVLRYVDKAAFLPRTKTGESSPIASLSQRAGVNAVIVAPGSAGTGTAGNIVVASEPRSPSLAGYLAVKDRFANNRAPRPDVIGAVPLATLPVDFMTAPGLVASHAPAIKPAPIARPGSRPFARVKAAPVPRVDATAPGETRARMHARQAFAAPQISALSQPEGRLEPLELTKELEVEQIAPVVRSGMPATDDTAAFAGSAGPASIGQIPVGRGVGRGLPRGFEGGVVQDRIVARVGGLEAGSVEFTQAQGTISVKLGSLLELVSTRLPADELERLSSSPALDEFLPIEKLQSAGLPIEYDPVYDEFKLGGKSERSANQMKSHIDQIGAPQESTSRTNMDQISGGL
ncbi:MAG: hypothetical protein WBA51_05510 [Erythrobacter sp.]